MALALLIVGAWGVHEHLAAGRWEDTAGKNAKAYQLETAMHAVTRMSLEQVVAVMADQSRSVRQLADESAARTGAADTARKAAELAAQASERTAAALDASAAKPHSGVPCAPSDVFWNGVRKNL